MSESARRIAVVGGDGADGDVREAIRDEGGTVTERVDADAVVAVGEDALVEVRDDGVPVLPVGTGRYAAARPDAPEAVRQLLAGEARRVAHPLLSVAVAGEHAGRALFDAALVTSEPARISEYGVSFPSGRETSFRADAVVVATPLGSDGYAAAAGGSVLDPGSGLSVVPVAPFTTQTDTWVADESLELRVERDEEPVSLVLDDAVHDDVPPYEPIAVSVEDRVEFLSVPATRAAE